VSGITDPAEAYFKDGLWGWDGSAWHKLPLLLGYSEALWLWDEDDDAGADTEIIALGAVDAGEVWIINSFSARDTNTDITRITLYLQRGDESHVVGEVFPGAVAESAIFSGRLVLREDDYLWAYFVGTVGGDDIKASATGYKMLIAE